MSNQETKYSLDKAMKVAEYILKLLQPHCDRIHLAGSIRRLRYKVSDIEIVCQPKKVFEQNGLFPENGEWMISKDFSEALMVITDIVLKGKIGGRMMRIRTTSKICPGIVLDLFMPQPHDYFRIYAIRTGSRDYAHAAIAGGWARKGWVGTEDGLRLKSQCIQTASGWVCQAEEPTLPPEWKSEGEFFTWLGLEYIDPEQREYHKPVNEAQ